MDETRLDPGLIHEIFKHVWNRTSQEREKNEANDVPNPLDNDVATIGAGTGTSKKNRPTSANANALKLSAELIQIFIAEAVQRASAIAEAEGETKIEATHFERILPQLLLDF
ncbi:Protein MHF2 homolog [Linum grandiflorum]